MPWRTFHCVLWTKSTVISGCLTCTAMNNVPAATAARPAARVSFVVVISMTSSVFPVPGAGARAGSEPTKRRGDATSPDDVIGWVRSSAVGPGQQAALAGAGHGFPSAGGAEL